MAFIGRLHPLLIHFPIALVIAAALAEVAVIVTADERWRNVAVANVRAGAVFALLATIAGRGLVRAESIAVTRNPGHEVQVVAKQFAFEPGVIQVTAGEPVRLVIRSADRVHGFAIRELNIDVQIPRSGNVVVEFTAPRAGRYEIACSEFCGSGHGHMKAAIVSVAATPAAGR